ncbi:MAG: ABC transporter ATP-binding protein, partial [Actinomycetota bacterium]|nr:ABC transporter ATP-binding protein [Actinomycetota bacterium]
MGDQPTAPTDRRPAHRLLAAVFRHGGPWVAVLLAASLLLAAAETALPALLGRALDAVVSGDDAGRWLVAAALLVAVLTIADALDDLSAGLSSARATSWLRRSVLGHVLATGPRAARRFAAGDLVTRLVANAAEAGRFATVSTWAVTSVLPAL